MILKIHMTLLFALFYNLYIAKNHVYFITYLFIIMHELSHMIVALCLNVDINEITLLPLGAIAKYNGSLTLWKEFLIAISGPLASFCFAFLYHNMLYFNINMLIILFNMFPIYPLDGGRIMRTIWITILGNQKGNKWNTYSNYFFVVCISVFAIYMMIVYHHYFLGIILAFVIHVFKEENKKEKMRNLINYLQMPK